MEKPFTWRNLKIGNEVFSMKVALVIPAGIKFIKEISSSIQAEFETAGFSVELLEIKKIDDKLQESSRLLSRIDLIILGAKVTSFSGDFTPTMGEFINKCLQLEGKKVALFVDKQTWGSQEALKALMKILESKGSFVLDFEILANSRQAAAFAHRLFSFKNAGKGI